MKKLWIACLAALPLFANAAVVTEGAYIGSQNKRISLANWEYEGVQQYSLMLVDNYRDTSAYLTTAKANKIQNNQRVIFNVPHNPYDEEDSGRASKSSCQVEVKFAGSEFQLKSLDGCSFDENIFNDSYAYSKKASIIPKKYWGKWGDCADPTYITKDTVSIESYYNHGIIGYEETANGIVINGVTFDEGYVNTSDLTFKFLKNNAVSFKSDWSDGFKTLKSCTK